MQKKIIVIVDRGIQIFLLASDLQKNGAKSNEQKTIEIQWQRLNPLFLFHKIHLSFECLWM